MPSEVFAEDIEALLERLDGVTAARVVATDAGEIDRIYVTASAEKDESKVRYSVAAALMSRYSLAVDNWRIRVARLRRDQPARPRWYMQKVEEILSATETKVTVELRTDEGTVAALVGRARGLTDAAGRLRTAAQATLDALKSLFEAEDRRVTVESIVPVALTAGKAMVVAITIMGASASDRYVGTAMVEGSETEAAIGATLDAVTKRGTGLVRRGWALRDRREELESMEDHYRRLRGPQRRMPLAARPAEGSPAVEALRDTLAADGIESETLEAGDVETKNADRRPLDRVPTRTVVEAPAAIPVEGSPAKTQDEDGWQDDSATALDQIRPERPGGAEVAQPMNRQDMERNRFAPKSSMEDDFFRHLVATGIPVHIRCRDGYEILEGILKDFGTYSLLVETDSGRELVF
ncbi:MAG TPA: hypothetical protein VFT63_01065, partial [bacterium]|nr:hypothetical protein [bacterium]